MKKEDIVKEIAKKTNIDESKLTDQASFVEDLNLDSIDLVEILMEIEEEYNIEISDDEAIKIKTVGDFTTTILKELNE